MSKQFCLILLPIIALLCLNTCMLYGYVSTTTKNDQAITSATFSSASIPAYSTLKKHEKKIDINAMRIKAKHDVVAMNIPTQWEPTILFVHHSKPYNSFYYVYELCAFHAGYHLRGPPAVA